MEIQSHIQTKPSVKPLQTTWGLKQDAGVWSITPSFDFTSLSTQQVNQWYVDITLKTINVFSPLCRVSAVSFTCSPSENTKPILIQWQSGSSYQKYLEKIVKGISEYPASIEILEMYVDMFVFVHTKESPDQPVRSWVNDLGHLAICGGKEYGEPYLYLEIEHTLFCNYSYEGKDNTELFNLNQPLLEKSLKNWEQKFNSEIEAEGQLEVYKYGFLAEDLITIDNN